MAEAEIPVDLFNPGQVFACLGFLEAAEVLLGDAKGGFDWSMQEQEGVKFRLQAAGNKNPVAVVLTFLAEAEVRAVAPASSQHNTAKWKVPLDPVEKGESFPFPNPPSPATLPARLIVPGKPPIQIDHWGDATARDNVKFWAGNSGKPGAALLRDALDLVRNNLKDAVEAPFSLSAPQSSSFRFDWRRDYIAIDLGFSPNKHKKNLTMMGFPVVEIMAAIGLSNARPERVHELEYRYGVIEAPALNQLLSPMLLRAALGCGRLPFPQRIFRMRLGRPGQENQARCIVDVVEEPRS